MEILVNLASRFVKIVVINRIQDIPEGSCSGECLVNIPVNTVEYGGGVIPGW